jgi:hypothetical protein
MTRTIGDGDKTDFDETRRLLYMALLVKRTKRYNLGGTLINALAHHHAVDLPADEITDHVVGMFDDSDGPDDEHRAWVQQQIDRISYELGD